MRKGGLLSKTIAGIGRVAEAPRASQLSVDYPQADEKVARGHYTVRISGAESGCEVSIDGGAWQACRQDCGYSWFDWNPDEAGAHRISVRADAGKTERTCRVI